MAYPTQKLLAVLLASFLASSATIISARKLDSTPTLLARLKLDEEGPSSCWDALFELHSCSGEVLLFFLNGETHLGPGCCSAIRIIEHQCWPSMLGSLGITPEESDILRGYCDAAAAAAAAPPPAALHHCYNLPRLVP
ncbi:Egg cell-secreted protein 1.1 [Sesamum alatum]|uniref:Egg cell-secreted protein 1.1 n=1 Tax=Sesamum alatum TaxID=300844 RepID=A0AAE1XZF8_9LAMI|nr:Egg cell-secreted protein 1.1 [Sesamum alatum]